MDEMDEGAERSREQPDQRPSSGLWDSIQPYLDALMQESWPGLSKDVVVGRSDASPPQTPYIGNQPTGVNTSDAQTDVEASMDVSTSATVLREDVEFIKARYIVGKTNGKDIIDANGRVIAKQGERITKRIVQAAEAAGLLVELIEHMTFDSYEDG